MKLPRLRRKQRRPSAPFGARLKIEAHGGTGRDARVWFNGQEISRCLRGVTLDIACDEVNHAELSIYVDRIDVDAQTLAALQALVERPAPSSGAIARY